MAESKIEWTDAVWNPVTGCSKVSAGCTNCYAERLWPRLRAMGNPAYKDRNFNDVACHPERLDQPMQWKKPRRIFVNSMSDLFHEKVPFGFISKVFREMWLSENHTFMILTKRPRRMLEYFNREETMFEIIEEDIGVNPLPLDNVWLGVSVENQAAADERIPLLLQTPAAVRFISAEPLLGPVKLPWLQYGFLDKNYYNILDWVIVGGESGPKARLMHPDWVRSLRDQCQAAGTKFFFKQWGEWLPNDQEYNCNPGGNDYNQRHEQIGNTVMCRVGKKKSGRLIDGRTWDEMPGQKP